MRIACVQTDVVFKNPIANAEKAVKKLEELKEQGVDLAIFPEAYLTGYCVNSEQEAEELAINASVDSNSELTSFHESLEAMHEATERIDIGCVIGFAGKNKLEGKFNAAALFEPSKAPRIYRKTHLPFLGYDRFALPGLELDLFGTKWGKIGILICFDQRPPEAARTLALKGADLIVLPTNWPIGAEVSAEHMSIARAAENKVFMATCNRVGIENGTSFIGKSKIIHCSGKVLASAGDGEETLIADIDVEEARQKRIVNIPGEYEMEVFKSRQPALYKIITDTSR